LNEIHAGAYIAEYHVLAIQPRSCDRSNHKLDKRHAGMDRKEEASNIRVKKSLMR
jgi:hypothetical protein